MTDVARLATRAVSFPARWMTSTFSLMNSARIGARHPVRICEISPVAHQATGRRELAILEDRGDRMAERQCGELLVPIHEECVCMDRESARSHRSQAFKGRINLALGAGI